MYFMMHESVLLDTFKKYPETEFNEEIRASFSHWLHNKEFLYKGLDQEIVDFWKSAVESFCASKNIAETELFAKIPFKSNDRKFDFIDLFAGIGGFNLALSAVGGQCVFSSEWDKSAKETYFRNYGKFPYGDINQFTNEAVSNEEIDSLIPDHAVLAAGFPCQPFSHAGVSARNALGTPHGFECETQGTLFHAIARIAYVKQPKVVFMENVRNIVGHDKGATFNVIRSTMESLSKNQRDKHNYKFFYTIINSESVVAQRRVRCYMVCIREDVWKSKGEREFMFPDISGKPIPLRAVVEHTLPTDAKAYTISDALWEGHVRRTKRNLARNTGFTAHEADLDRPANTIVARYGKDGKECLIPQENSNPRMLTIDECRQLFGYPEQFKLPTSKTSAYKQFGNSVVVPVVQRLASEVVDYIG